MPSSDFLALRLARWAATELLDALGVVEVEQHGGAVSDGLEEVFETAEGMGADDVALEADEVVGHLLVFAEVDVEVVEPEVGHDLLELGAGVDVVGEALGEELLDDGLVGIFQVFDGFAEVGRETGEEGLALGSAEGFDEGVEVGGGHGLEAADAVGGGEGQNRLNEGWVGHLRWGRRGLRRSGFGGGIHISGWVGG